ncbi:MAG: lipoyl synthase [Syntrophothermus sp.]|uniref:lipoyl synthase n=1 Tax=Syntrophothermus sp. TaxID=2736299 RepID=UPI00257E777C|nr:lipoyl synthase [Syntrophothermus sp.]NSW82642.1 lipoyl synthase [Syntrophothermus sp.]
MGRTAAPEWLLETVRKAKRPENVTVYKDTSNEVTAHRLNTVCEEARCPNRGDCFSRGSATFMILGDVCTRNCRFCAVKHGRPVPLDPEEPLRIGRAVKNLGLRHIVITSVTRDDLVDGGAGHFAAVIRELHGLPNPPSVEVLVPDFKGSSEALNQVLDAEPEVFAHNVEMVPRLYREVRPGAVYERSLDVLAAAQKESCPGTVTKSGFMLGLGETEREVLALLEDLRDAGVALLTIGQYLAPSWRHYPVARYVTAEEFAEWEKVAYKMGFLGVASGPLVRSSYRAGYYYRKVTDGV